MVSSNDALNIYKDRLRLFMEAMPVGIFIVRTSGTIEAANSKAQEMFACSAKEIATKKVAHFIFPAKGFSSADEEDDCLATLLRVDQRACQLTARDFKGRTFPVEASLRPFDVQQGRRYLVVVSDISDKFELEKLKKEFVAIASHELKSPLTSVQGFLTMLADKVYDDVSDKVCEKAARAAVQINRLISLINELLDMEKIESGNFPLTMENLHVFEIVESAKAAVIDAAEMQNISIGNEVKSLTVLGDKDRLIQVVVNLLSNALKHSASGTAVAVSAKELDSWIEVSVRDQGPGIDAKFHEVIFERFQQVQDSGQTHRKGVGLGLPICKSIILQHGGIIGVDSQPGSGSRFWFRLPKREATME